MFDHLDTEYSNLVARDAATEEFDRMVATVPAWNEAWGDDALAECAAWDAASDFYADEV